MQAYMYHMDLVTKFSWNASKQLKFTREVLHVVWILIPRATYAIR